MNRLYTILAPLVALLFAMMTSIANASDLARFEGTFQGTADVTLADGTQEQRDMSTTIAPEKDGFMLSWTSVTYKSDGRTKEKTYEIDFVPSTRENIYQSAMKTNLFGKATPLDPLQGEPFVWARFEDDTFTVFSLFINEVGDYEVQEFHRTLVDGGLDLLFRRLRNGVQEREIRTLLERQN